MAPAVLASRSEPFWGQCEVYMRKHTNNSVADSNIPLSKFDSNSSPNPRFKQIRSHDSSYKARFWLGEDCWNLAGFGASALANRSNVEVQVTCESSNDRYLSFNLSDYTKIQLKELKKRLISELEQVRILRNRVESGFYESEPIRAAHDASASRSPSSVPPNETAPSKASKKKGQGLKRSSSLRQVTDVDPAPDPKRLAANPESEKVLAIIMKRCAQILAKLMKHKWGWVFNTPVDVVGLGLHDYYQIIKQPMDLGTVKSNLEKGLYLSPLDFSADVRLTFGNAMTYNPKGQDVYLMAEQLLRMFEDMFNPAYKKFEAEQQKLINSVAETSSRQPEANVGVWSQKTKVEKVSRGPEPISIAKKLDSVKQRPALPKPTSPPPPQPSPPPPVASQAEAPAASETGKVRKGKQPKPKAKDPNKRPMTIEEKAKLGMNLQDLPQEKLGHLMQILKKRNGHLAQDGDEIELDIEAIDNETLWELDRFVTNYKKMVSKIKRQGFIQNQISAPQMDQRTTLEMGSGERKSKKTDVVEEDVDIGEDIPISSYPSVEIEKDATAAASSGSSSSGSSSSSSGSSSSDSDSGSSSGSDSDGDCAQSPFVESKEGRRD